MFVSKRCNRTLTSYYGKGIQNRYTVDASSSPQYDCFLGRPEYEALTFEHARLFGVRLVSQARNTAHWIPAISDRVRMALDDGLLEGWPGEGTSIWHHTQIRENARLGQNCVIGKEVYIDYEVNLGDNVKVQNFVSI